MCGRGASSFTSDFAYEASILVSGDGEHYVTFPVVRNIHRNNILHMTLAPAEVGTALEESARALAIELARGFKLAGTLAIELFVTNDGGVLVNRRRPTPAQGRSRCAARSARGRHSRLRSS